MDRLDSYGTLPRDMEEYLSNHGWHFSKKMCDHAVSCMKDRSGNKITPYTKEKVEALLKQYNIEVKNAKGYDCVYVVNMALADYHGSSIADTQRLAMFVRDYIDDADGYEGIALTRYYADCIGKGEPIEWGEMI